MPGLLDAYASYETVGLAVEPNTFEIASVRVELFDSGDTGGEPRTHTIPVCYAKGEDLDEACAVLEMDRDEFVEVHTGAVYRCFAVGFCPGFAYLGYLPEGIARLPRRPQPRPRIVPGSLAITGRQTAVYPLERPGGWTIVGRTPLTLVDPATAYFPIAAGDCVKFESIAQAAFDRLVGTRL